jgi:hypothetical protein
MEVSQILVKRELVEKEATDCPYYLIYPLALSTASAPNHWE